MTRFAYALRLWRWWPPIAWSRWAHDGLYDAYTDMTWRTAWGVAGLVVCDD